jgi:hypothetical protein
MLRYALLMESDFSRAEMSPRERELRSRAAQLLASGGLLHGYIVERERKCGRRTCKCERGEKHPAVYVYRRQEGKLRQLYVGKVHDVSVRRWVEQDRELRSLLEEIWEIHWERVRGHGRPGREG